MKTHNLPCVGVFLITLFSHVRGYTKHGEYYDKGRDNFVSCGSTTQVEEGVKYYIRDEERHGGYDEGPHRRHRREALAGERYPPYTSYGGKGRHPEKNQEPARPSGRQDPRRGHYVKADHDPKNGNAKHGNAGGDPHRGQESYRPQHVNSAGDPKRGQEPKKPQYVNAGPDLKRGHQDLRKGQYQNSATIKDPKRDEGPPRAYPRRLQNSRRGQYERHNPNQQIPESTYKNESDSLHELYQRSSCIWNFVSNGTCELMVRFEHYLPGEQLCSHQYILISDEDHEIQACSHRELPFEFESTTNQIAVKHFRRRNVRVSSEFVGFAICRPRGHLGYKTQYNKTKTVPIYNQNKVTSIPNTGGNNNNSTSGGNNTMTNTPTEAGVTLNSTDSSSNSTSDPLLTGYPNNDEEENYYDEDPAYPKYRE